MKRPLKIFLSLIVALLLIISVIALLFWNSWRLNAPASVESVKLANTSHKIGQPFKITILIKTPWYRQVTEPVSLSGSPDVTLSGTALLTPITLDSKSLYWQLTSEFIAFKEGTYKDLKLTTSLSPDKDDKQQELLIDIPELKISGSDITKADKISMQQELDESIFVVPAVVEEEKTPLWLWFAVAAGVIAIFAVFLLYRKKTKNIKILTSWEVAQKALAELKENETVNDEKFFVFLSDILRLYIQKRFQLPATEKTSEEFIQQVRNESVLTESHKHSLESFLATADMVKFAKMTTGQQQRQDCLNMAGNFIQETIPQINEGAS